MAFSQKLQHNPQVPRDIFASLQDFPKRCHQDHHHYRHHHSYHHRQKQQQRRRRRRRSHGVPLVILITLVTLVTIFISSSVLLLPVQAVAFEVLVTKPSTRVTDASSSTKLLNSENKGNKTSRVLAGSNGNPFKSKYLGNAIVTNAKNLGYSGTIVLGNNPPQLFEVVFDTGSDMIVVTSDHCKGLHCDDMAHYKCSSCSRTPYSYNITYGDGTWGSGPIVSDSVSIGGLVIHNQQILDITRRLMPSSPIKNAIPPLATIFKSKLLDMNVFSVYLTPVLDRNQGGSFLFGGVDRTKYVGELNQVPISIAPGVREGIWYVEADNAYVGDTPVTGYTQSPWLFDTGTSFIAVPSSFAEEFHANIPGSAYSEADRVYTLPCEGNHTFGISFNGIKYEVPYSDYIAVASSSDDGGSTNASLCVSLIMFGDYDMYILGDPFLRQVYTVYDFTPGAGRIGLGKINVTSVSLGIEGLSGSPVPGGTIITPVKDKSSSAKSLLFEPRFKFKLDISANLMTTLASLSIFIITTTFIISA
ncbi:Vacuolar protease A [Lobosporangium transversale]|uniref:Aspartic peptidase domain-containing protein n=1 Tax=Lobosporangium transversale TaxID=64571 RepID=A0A1Y2GF91_9FUNG|nr:aspartic peptidase domain-containing protein [Lobosporangium transversale]KAF9914664.1 Vacuolar protease A [Lobosporangium transversale]ORZ09107.1 aspartic peptidase domain-containing protein [Lobosporangium transversale]|eukprot:XP_021878734.1 aspartic peptidase domain-containing protein [Lobosporangium transversale]